MNGAERLLETLVDAGVEICFANPGTSEMQLVSAIGNNDDMRAVLCLFEGVVSGAADGYARMTDKPAVTLLHVGSGFSNSMANQHNAKRAHVPLVNVVGDHATYHLQYDAPLTSDVPGHASADTISELAAALSNGKATALYLGGRALREESLAAAGLIANATGARILCETFPARLQRGQGRVPVERLPYFAEQAAEVLSGFEQLVLVGAAAPVSFFAYPGKDSFLTPGSCEILKLADVHQDTAAALRAVALELSADEPAETAQAAPGAPSPSGILTPMAIAQSLVQLMPDNAIVSDEAATCGLPMFPATVNAPPHEWMTITGGAIGQGLPLSLGAAIACPDQKVIALQADGSAMYTLQALWSMARENTDVTVVIFNNRSYAILNIELARVGAGQPTPKTLSMFDLSRPDIDWVKLSKGMGVPATRATSAEEFHRQFGEAMAHRGPRLIEAMVIQQMP